MNIHIQNLFYFAPLEMRSVSKPDRTFQPPRPQNLAKCQQPGCDGYLIPFREDGRRVLLCDQCQAPADPGLDPGDIEMQGRTFTGGQA